MSFQSEYASLYDLFHAGKNYQIEIESILKLLPDDYFTNHPLKVLDFGCGTGIHLHELNKQGFEAVGYDSSIAMIEKAKLRAPNLLFTSDFSKVGKDFGLALSLFDVASYQHSHSGLKDMLAMMTAVLVPGGRLIIDSWQTGGVRIDPPRLSVREVSFGGEIFERSVRPLSSNETEEMTGSLQFELEVKVVNKTRGALLSNELHQVRTWSQDEIALIGTQVGLKLITQFNPKDFGKSSQTDWRVGLILEKL